MAIRIITDSASDLPGNLAKNLNVDIVPLRVTFGDHTFTEGVDIAPEEFFERLAAYPGLPKTSQPSPDDFRKAIDAALERGEEPIVVTLASSLSGTYNSALLAAEGYGERVRVIDSYNGTMGLGLLIIQAAELVRQGVSIQGLLRHIHEWRDRIHTFVLLNTLENVVKGGRLNRVAGAVASVLNLKPIITKLPQGSIAHLESVRGRKRSFTRVIELMADQIRDWASTRVGITHAACLPDALELKTMIENAFSPREVMVSLMGSSIGTYAGIGGITVSF